MTTSTLLAKNQTDLYKKAAQIFLEAVAEAVRERGKAAVAVSGGTTPEKLFKLLADDYHRGRLPWSDLHIFWVDERCVPPNHADSNFAMTQKALLSKVPLPEANIHRMPGEMLPPRDGAKAYEHALKAFFNLDLSFPKFDFILLGMGDDGHTASLFPNTEALNEKDHWVVANHVEKLKSDRLTLTYPILNNARKVLILCSGVGKAVILKEVFRDETSLRYPIQRVKPDTGELIWLFDAEAASELPNETRYKAFHLE